MDNELPVYITAIYNEYTDLIFSCETKRLNYAFEIIYSTSENTIWLNFDAESYWAYDIEWCDFQSDLWWLLDKSDLIHYFEDNYWIIYKTYIFENYIEKKNKYYADIDDILSYLREKNSDFDSLESWKMNCYAVSSELYDCFVDKYEWLELVYGKWLWYIDERSVFSKWIANHGWLEFKVWNNTYVIDPTRWVFEWTEAYIYINKKWSEYDRASQYFQKSMRNFKISAIPLKKNNDNIIDISFWKEIDSFIFETILNSEYNYYTIRSINYIANTPVDLLWKYTIDIFDILKENWYNSFIPIDTQELIYNKK